MGYGGAVDSRKNSENLSQRKAFHTFPDRNARQVGYTRTGVLGNAGMNKEFRVVRDNRINHNATGGAKHALQQGLTSCSEQDIVTVPEKGYIYCLFSAFLLLLSIYSKLLLVIKILHVYRTIFMFPGFR